ncbi:uncharacterized protein V6R79_014255 [Siganus canaliculatus]
MILGPRPLHVRDVGHFWEAFVYEFILFRPDDLMDRDLRFSRVRLMLEGFQHPDYCHETQVNKTTCISGSSCKSWIKVKDLFACVRMLSPDSVAKMEKATELLVESSTAELINVSSRWRRLDRRQNRADYVKADMMQRYLQEHVQKKIKTLY